MLACSGDGRLPQLHVDGRFIGGADRIQELQDFGELKPLLQ